MRALDELLSERQRQFYDDLGARAFHGTVPFRLSTSVAMASVVLAAARAFAVERGLRRIHLVDVGAGSGRLAAQLARLSAADELRLTLTDASAPMVAAWHEHPNLAPLFAAGRLRALEASAETLGSLVEVRPDEALVFVGTYLLDTLPHVLLEAPSATLALVDDSGVPSFDEAASDPFLRTWAQRLGHGRAFVPTGAFQFLRGLEATLEAPALVLLADKGARTLDEAREGEALRLAAHGAGASVFVNFEALRCWLGWRGWVEAGANEADFVIGATLLHRGGSSLARVHTALSATTHPLTAQRAVTALRSAPSAALVEGVVGLEPDGDAVLELADALVSAADTLGPEARAALGRWLLDSVRGAFFLPADDVAFHAGRVLQRLGFAAAAASCFGHSLLHHGDVVSARFNLAVCLLELGERGRAGAELQAVLAREPGHEKAKALLQQLGSGALRP